MSTYAHMKKGDQRSQDKIYNLKALYVSHIPLNTSKCLHPSYGH